MTFQTAIATCMGKYATFSGRAPRSEFWWFMLFTHLMMIAGNLDSAAWGVDEFEQDIVSGFYVLVFLLPTLAAGARRLHDVAKSGWWQLLVFTGIGTLLVVYWMAQKGSVTDNSHGEVPEP